MAKDKNATVKKARTPIDPNETNAARFKRVAGRRAGEIIDSLELLGNCAVTTTYEYTPSQVKTISDAIDKAVIEMKNMFATGGTKAAKKGFML